MPTVLLTSQSTPAQCMFAHFTRLGPCAKTQSVKLTHFFLAQTVTISVATAGYFSLDLGFSSFIWVSGVFIENLGFVWLWSNFRNVSCITVFSIQDYSRFIGVMCRVSTVEKGKASPNRLKYNVLQIKHWLGIGQLPIYRWYVKGCLLCMILECFVWFWRCCGW